MLPDRGIDSFVEVAILHQLMLFSSNSEVGDVMNAHEYLNYEMEFDLNNPYEPTDEEFLDMYSSEDQEIDVDEVMVDVIEEVVGFSVLECSLETLKKYFKQRPNDALSHIMSIQGHRRKFHLIIWKLLVILL